MANGELRSRAITADKHADFSLWYDQVIFNAGIVDKRYGVKGMFVWMNHGYEAMLRLKSVWDAMFKEDGIKEMYFPLVVPLDYASKNTEWLEGFKNEAFWVTFAGEKEPTHILRPTGEPAMYPMFSLWIRSHKDLPLRVYENVSSFRYETKMTRPLIRDREITLWHEIHTVHETKGEADEEIQKAIGFYEKLYSDLCIPALKVNKPKWECFPGSVGAVEFYTIMPNGKAMENGSCNNLGQAYAKKFGVKFVGRDRKEKFAWQTCTGNGARFLVAAIAQHGDSRGLVLPPKIAPVQCVVCALLLDRKREKVLEKAGKIAEGLRKTGIRTEVDAREMTPGEKFFDLEIKGIPVRVEVGPKDLENEEYFVFRRDTLEKKPVKEASVQKTVSGMLKSIEGSLLEKAKAFYGERVVDAGSKEELASALGGGKIARVAWCGSDSCWDAVKETGEGTEFFGTELIGKKGKCVVCGKPSGETGFVGSTY